MQIVGDDALTRSGIAGLLAGREDILVVGQLEPAAIDEAPALEADVVAWDVGPAVSQGWAIQLPRQDLPVLALLWDESQAEAALAAGARGALLRDVSADRLAAALSAAARGLVVLDDALEGMLPRTREVEEALPEQLTPREREVLGLLAEGLSNKAIASRLGISDHTAKFHVNAILGKLGAETRTEAIVHAVRLGLILL